MADPISPSHLSATPLPPVGAYYWRNLYRKLLDDLQSDAWRLMNSYTVAGRSVSYRSLEEFRKLLDWVKDQADLEEGIPPYRGRTYAGIPSGGASGYRLDPARAVALSHRGRRKRQNSRRRSSGRNP